MGESERKPITQGRSALLAKLERYSQSDTAYHIQSHWQKRGHVNVRVWVEMVKLPGRDSRLEIRSNLLNGRPRRNGEGEGRSDPKDSGRILQYSGSSYDERMPEEIHSSPSNDCDDANTGAHKAILIEDRPNIRGQASYNRFERDAKSSGNLGGVGADSAGR